MIYFTVFLNKLIWISIKMTVTNYISIIIINLFLYK